MGMKRFSGFCIFASCLCTLVACGGGSSGGGGTTTPTYSVGGTVSGLSGSGLALKNGSETLPISANGSFAFKTKVASSTPYNVTVASQPVSPTQTCSVTNGSGTVGSANVTSVQVNCVTNSYSVGGTVSGLSGTGLALTNGIETLPISANGSFTFTTAVASGANYNVTVTGQPVSPPQTCSVTNGSGTVGGTDVTNVQVTCVTNSYTVGGIVTGLKGSGLELSNNGDLTPISDNGSFALTTAVTSGASYSVAVSIQPVSPAQTCSVTNGSGTVGSANVTNVLINCGTWTRQLGSVPASTPPVVNDDYGLATAIDASGNIYVTGYTQGDLPGAANPDATHIVAAAYVVKYDQYGKKIWTQEFGNSPASGHLLGLAIAADGNGHVYVAGSTRGNFDGHTLSAATAADLFVVQFDQATGAKGWSAQLGAAGTTATHAYGVATDNNGNVYAAGSTNGSLGGQANLGGYDLFVVKYNSSGTRQWTRQFGSSLNDKNDGVNLETNGNIIAADASGNVHVTGYTYGNLPASPDGFANPGNPDGTFATTDAVVAKFDTDGTLVWTRQFGTNLDDKGNGIALDASVNVYVAGMTDGNLDGAPPGGIHDVFVVKYGANGGGSSGTQAGLVQFRAAGNLATIGYGVVTDTTGAYVAGAVFNSTTLAYDLLVLKFNQGLVWQWTQTLGAGTSGLDTKGYGIGFDGITSTIYAAGWTEGGLDGNLNTGTDSVTTPPGLQDLFLVKYNQSGTLQ